MKYEKGDIFRRKGSDRDHLEIIWALPSENSYIGRIIYKGRKSDGTEVFLPAFYVEKNTTSTNLKISEEQLERTGEPIGKLGSEGVPKIVPFSLYGPAEI